jgi:uncharacterized membrane protein
MAQTILRLGLAALFIAAGIAHFRTPDPFAKIVPPYLPAPYVLVYVSGIFEVLGGLGILVPSARQIAAWGLIALLLAVFPANIYMATAGIKFGGFPSQAWMAWARLPFQFVLIGLVYWSCELSAPWE